MSEPKRFTGRQVTVMVTAVCAAVVALPAGVFAATGGTFVLGHSNSAGHTTALKNSGTGAALSLAAAKSSTPVLSVGTNKARIPNLDADLLDGLHASSLQRRVSGTCGAGSAVASISSSGGAGCRGTVVGYSTPGTYSYVAPAGVTHVVVELWGAGGGGAGNNNTCAGAGGGGQGAYERVLVPITPGTSYKVIVGKGGVGGDIPTTCFSTGVGGTGGLSEFTDSDQAAGGLGGANAGNSGGFGGAGGDPSVALGAGISATSGAVGGPTDGGTGTAPGGGPAGFVGSGGGTTHNLVGLAGDPGIDGLVVIEPA